MHTKEFWEEKMIMMMLLKNGLHARYTKLTGRKANVKYKQGTLLMRVVISPGVKPSYTPVKMGMAMMM